jgi:low temperature requirement protein LtrA
MDFRDETHDEFLAASGGYVVGMGASAAVILASALLPATPRLVVRAGLAIAWIVGIVLAARSSRAGLWLAPTDSLVERFGEFTIIVLGEVAIGVEARLEGEQLGVLGKGLGGSQRVSSCHASLRSNAMQHGA